MSTITTPRLSNPSASPSSTPSTSRASSPGPNRRPNRVALRDYYNLKSAGPTTDATSNAHPSEPEPQSSELDAADFDADAYVKSVLARNGLEGLLRVEGGLINEIRGLDGERKALVYDNYSKLITATDTIRKMRNNMDPLTPTTSTLGPAVAHIAETAKGLAAAVQGRVAESEKAGRDAVQGDQALKRKQRETVKWVLGAPKRLEAKLEEGRKADAKADWDEIQHLLEKWDGVAGVEEIEAECEKIMSRVSAS